MANVNAPYGLKLIQGPEIIRPVICPSTSSAVLGYGDPVLITTLSGGQLTMIRTTAGSGINGIVIQPKVSNYNYTDTDRRRTASVTATMDVLLVDPGLHILSIQGNSNTFDAALANKYCDLATVGDADALTALSTVVVDTATAHASQGDLFVLGLDTTAGRTNNAGDSYPRLLVRVANT